MNSPETPILQRLLTRFVGHEKHKETRLFWVAFVAIVLAGLVLRFWNLSSAPIWMDEAVTLAFADLPLATILFDAIDNHPPLSFVIQHAWQGLVPDPDFARVPAAIAGTLGLLTVMLAMRDQVSPRAALIAGLLLAFSTSHIYFSQDARMYPYLILGLAMAMWGGLGNVLENLHRPRIYNALYVIGAAIAIYSHLIGLIVMALIGFASLAAGVMGPARGRFMRGWLTRNLILLMITLPWLLQIPAASASFPGLSGTNSLIDIHWFYRNATGFPGLNGAPALIELLLYAVAALSTPLAWHSGRRGLALMLGGLIVLYPLIILGLHIRQPILSNKVLLPSILGITLGAAYTLAVLRPKLLGVALATILGMAALWSSVTELKHHIKMEDYGGAFAYVDAQGYGDAPVLTCIHFSAAAVWEARREANILYSRGSNVIHYQGRDYWQAAARSMVWLRAASAREIDAELGGGWLIEGGLATALAGQTQLAFMRPFCPGDNGSDIEAEIVALGFRRDSETLIRGKAASFTILNGPLTRVSLFVRDSPAEEAE